MSEVAAVEISVAKINKPGHPHDGMYVTVMKQHFQDGSEKTEMSDPFQTQAEAETAKRVVEKLIKPLKLEPSELS